MNRNLSDAQNGAAVYCLLSVVQLFGARFVIGEGVPALTELSLHLGEQPKSIPYDNYTTICVLCLMQAAYWYRFEYIKIPFRAPSVILNHLFLFFGRLSVIFGGALFSVVVFRIPSGASISKTLPSMMAMMEAGAPRAN
jgi:hypothetical protein